LVGSYKYLTKVRTEFLAQLRDCQDRKSLLHLQDLVCNHIVRGQSPTARGYLSPKLHGVKSHKAVIRENLKYHTEILLEKVTVCRYLSTKQHGVKYHKAVILENLKYHTEILHVKVNVCRYLSTKLHGVKSHKEVICENLKFHTEILHGKATVCRYLSTKLHGVISHKLPVFIVIIVRTSDPHIPT
jgi:hypothetical protein